MLKSNYSNFSISLQLGNLTTRIKPFCFGGLALSIFLALSYAQPVLAHHPMGGKTPSNFIQGFLSGLGHPVIGIDHLVFAIAIGLLAVLITNWGAILPVAFMAATLIGTTIHVQGIDLPIVEVMIALSLIGIGILLASKEIPNNTGLLTVLSAIAGVFHGYAYGESIIGAETTALFAYLLGFALIQLAISLGAYLIGHKIRQQSQGKTPFHYVGLAIAGVGFVFLGSTILG